MKKLLILVTLLGLVNCSSTKSREIKFSEDTSRQLSNVPSTEIAKCQIYCFRGAHKGISNTTAVQLFNYMDVEKFTNELQACNFGCYRERNEWDELQDVLTQSASRTE